MTNRSDTLRRCLLLLREPSGGRWRRRRLRAVDSLLGRAISGTELLRYDAPMTEGVLRAAVIGLGAMGSNHVRVYTELRGIELVAVADIDEERVGAATRGRTLRGYADYRRLL